MPGHPDDLHGTQRVLAHGLLCSPGLATASQSRPRRVLLALQIPAPERVLSCDHCHWGTWRKVLRLQPHFAAVKTCRSVALRGLRRVISAMKLADMFRGRALVDALNCLKSPG